ncbi:MAG: hypothetical protein JXR77_18780 [Lentisphaeria bacterium]|nr:hypothetical protein [Lentisphaeria bacterium]
MRSAIRASRAWGGGMLLATALRAAGDGGGRGLADVASPALLGVVLVLTGIGFASVSVLVQVVAPRTTRAAAELAGRTPWRSAVYGVLLTLIVVLGVGILQALPGPLRRLLAIALAGPCLLLVLLGATAVCHALGERILTAAQSPRMCSDVWAVGVGALFLALANLLPALGQAVGLAALLTGIGAVGRHILGRRRAAGTAPLPPPMPPPDLPRAPDPGPVPPGAP